MKTEELRIGNLVNYTGEHGGIFDVEGILPPSDGFKDYSLILRKGSYRMSIESDEDLEHRFIQPIPLTEEWLLKLGFEEIESEEEYYRYGIFKEDLNLILDNDNDTELEDGAGFIYIPQKIKCVHQLQNLYFALTGEELYKQ